MKPIRKYRNELTVLILAFFLAGGFQFPLLEGLHFFSHLNDVLAGTHQSHRYHAHDETHHHTNLKMLDAVADAASDEAPPVKSASDSDLSKSPQIVTHAQLAGHLLSPENSLSDHYATLLPSVFPKVTTPPPRV